MKKVFLLVMLVAGILFGAEAQNRSINFEQTKVWKQIVKKRRRRKADFRRLLHFLVRPV